MLKSSLKCVEAWRASSPQWYLGTLCAVDAAPAIGARVMLHEWRLGGCHRFQEIRLSVSENGVASPHDTHTHSHKHPYQSRLQVSGKCDRLSARPTCALVLCLDEIWPAHSLSPPPSRFCAFSLAGMSNWGVRCAYSTVVRVRLSLATCARCMCRGERCPTDTHFMQSRRAWCGGDERLEDGAHGQ